MFSLKHFLLGAGLALLPVSFYGYIRLATKPVSTLEILASKQQEKELEERLSILEVDYEPGPTATPTPTKVPPIPKSDVKLTASMEVHKPQVEKTQQPVSGPNDVQTIIDRYSAEYGVNRDMMTHIAKCESGFRANAVSGPYGGIYQFVSSTWVSNRKAMGLDPNPALRFNAEEAAKTAAFKMSRDGFGAWPECFRKAQSALGLAKQ